MATSSPSGFNDPTAQRLERITTGADPQVVGPLLASALHDPRWLECDVALVSGGKSNLTYRVASDAGEVILRRPPLGQILPTAHDMVREHRVLTALEGTAVPVPRVLYLGDADAGLGAPFYVMERVLGHICRNALPPGYADTPEDRRVIGEALVDVLADLHTVEPGRRGPRGVRPAGRLHGAPAAPLGAAVGRVEGPGAAGARRAAGRPRPRPSRATGRSPSSTGTTAWTTPSCIRRGRADHRGARLGDEHARGSVRRPRVAAVVLERGGGPRRPAVRADRRARHRRRGIPVPGRGDRALLRGARGSTSPPSTGSRPSPSSSSRSSARASPPAPTAGRWWAGGSTTPAASWRRSSTRGGTCSPRGPPPDDPGF